MFKKILGEAVNTIEKSFPDIILWDKENSLTELLNEYFIAVETESWG